MRSTNSINAIVTNNVAANSTVAVGLAGMDVLRAVASHLPRLPVGPSRAYRFSFTGPEQPARKTAGGISADRDQSCHDQRGSSWSRHSRSRQLPSIGNWQPRG